MIQVAGHKPIKAYTCETCKAKMSDYKFYLKHLAWHQVMNELCRGTIGLRVGAGAAKSVIRHKKPPTACKDCGAEANHRGRCGRCYQRRRNKKRELHT